MTLAVPLVGPPSPEAASRCSRVGINLATAMIRWEDVEDEIDDGLPEFVYGCTDDEALNYNPEANVLPKKLDFAVAGIFKKDKPPSVSDALSGNIIKSSSINILFIDYNSFIPSGIVFWESKH